MRRVLALVCTLLITVMVASAPAYAAWTARVLGAGTVQLTAVNRASAPTAASSAGRLDLGWPAVTTASGAPVTGYEVVRHVGSTTTTVCTVAAPVRTCADPSPVAGSASYGVVARLAGWRGPESPLTAVTYDVTAPTTTLSSDASLNGAGWSTRAVSVGLSATDGSGSGVKTLTRQVNGGTPVATTGAAASVTLSAEGSNTLLYAATDNAGNVETTKTYTVKVDTVAPVTTATTDTAPNAAGWHNTSPVVLTLSPADDTSGVSSLRWRSGTSGTWTAAASWPLQLPQTVASGATGTFTIQYQATDAAGNLESIRTSTIKIDRGAPAAPTALALSADTGAVTTDAITYTAVQSLKGSAEAGTSVEVRVDGTLVGTGTADAAGSFTVPMGTLTAGTRAVTAIAVDDAGNRSAAGSLTVRLDQTAPTVAITFPGPSSYASNSYRAGCGTTNTYDVCGTSADPAGAYTSGVRSVEVEIRSGTTCLTSLGTLTTAGCSTRLTATGTTSWSYTTPVLAVGSYTLTAWVTDLAGNTSQVSVAFLRS